MFRWLVAGFIALVALASVWGSAVLAQTTAPTAQTSSTPGAFDSLSPGNQKIARALYDAQTTGSGGTTTTQPLTLDEIAAKKQSGQGWGNVFKDLKAQGLVQEKNLGQVVSRQHRAGNGHVVTASGREVRDDRHGARHSGGRGDDDGNRHGSKPEGNHEYGGHGEQYRGHDGGHGRYEHSSSGRGHAYASGSGRTESGRSGGGSGHGGRGGK